MRRALRLSVLLLPLCSCLYVRPHDRYYDRHSASGTYIQGILGAAQVDPDLTINPLTGLEARAGDFTAPVLGGVAQTLFDGGDQGLGIEGGVTVAFDNDLAVVATNAGLTTADKDIVLADLFGGLLLQVPIDRARLYGSAGVLVQYAEVDLEFADGANFVRVDDAEFGVGVYGRIGLEVPFSGSRLVGLGARWIASDLDVSGAADIDIDELQLVFTVTDRW